MLKTLRLSFSLKNTYRVNSILYAIRQIPLINKIIPSTVYQISGFKIFANVLSVLWEIISVFLGKILYFIIMIVGAAQLLNVPKELGAQVTLHLILILSIIGAAANTYMFNPTKDKYYAMILLGMDARGYTLINYFYSILKVIAGFTLCAFVFGMPMGMSAWQCLIVPFFVAGVKLAFAAKLLLSYEKHGTVNNENKLSKLWWIALFLLIGAAYGLPAIRFMIPEFVSVICMCIGILVGLLSLRKILTFSYYRQMYKEMLMDVVVIDPATTQSIQTDSSRNKISTDVGITSSRKGFEYLNELFIKRHQKLLWKPVKKITAVVLVLIVIALIASKFVPEFKTNLNRVLMAYLPYMVFVMYAINRGTGFTQALFINCDHSLLTYSFYKQPKNILKLYWIRLREIIKVNLLPASFIGAGLAFLLFATGGTDNQLNYVVLFVSIVALSIFFSVHYLTLYYLLQPYNAGTEITSGTYQLITSGTYIVCYTMMRFKMSTLIFGVMTIVFCIIYCVVASILVYKFAPKTFRIRT